MSVRAIIGWVFLGLLAASFGGLMLSMKHAARLEEKVEAHAACVASVEGAKGARPSDQTCEKPIAEADAIADRAVACEGALEANVNSAEGTTITASNGVAVMAKCLPQVARLFGQGLTDASSILDLRGQIDAATTDRNRAVARAEARGRALALRDRHAQALAVSAPRDSDGLRVYDAERLRERFEADPVVD